MCSSLKNIIEADPEKLGYDAAMKGILSHLPIASQIIKETVPEFANMSCEDIGNCIIGVYPSCIGVDPDTSHPKVRRVTGMNPEDVSVTEGKTVYDLKLVARHPKTGNKSLLIINLEAQNTEYETTLGYDIIHRAIYYVSRLISSQKDEVFFNTDYDKICKVYSIWLIEAPTARDRNSVIALKWSEYSHYGMAKINPARYDLQRLVFVFLGKDGHRPRLKTIRLFNTLIDSKLSSRAKLKKLSKMGIPVDEKIEKEVIKLCNFSVGIAVKARDEGRAEGHAEGYAECQHNLMALYQFFEKNGQPENAKRIMNDAKFAAKMLKKYKDQI